MRSRGSSGKEFESSEPTVILDKAQQESLINELEAEATRAAAVWRAVFGGGSVIIGLYFLALSATVFTSPAGSTDFWRGVRVRVSAWCQNKKTKKRRSETR